MTKFEIVACSILLVFNLVGWAYIYDKHCSTPPAREFKVQQ